MVSIPAAWSVAIVDAIIIGFVGDSTLCGKMGGHQILMRMQATSMTPCRQNVLVGVHVELAGAIRSLGAAQTMPLPWSMTPLLPDFLEMLVVIRNVDADDGAGCY